KLTLNSLSQETKNQQPTGHQLHIPSHKSTMSKNPEPSGSIPISLLHQRFSAAPLVVGSRVIALAPKTRKRFFKKSVTPLLTIRHIPRPGAIPSGEISEKPGA
ncbi:hypothetical protein, partial [Elstera cyanobacteriorum]|uniref:hypothetical protein n=1 Tax=Elstera cyanobacteriorum TaxID=2022747 RepID=UPI001BAF4603